MDEEKLIDAIGNIDDELIEAADRRRTAKHTLKLPRGGIIASAACVIVCVGAVLLTVRHTSPIIPDGASGVGDMEFDGNVETIVGADPEVAASDGSENVGVTVPPIKIEAGGFEHPEDSIGYFAYEGRVYLQSQKLYGESALDIYIGKTSNIFESEPPYGYYDDLAGNLEGDVYTVKHFPAEYMLAVRMSDSVFTYTCMNGVTYKSAAELFDTRLGLRENYSRFAYTLTSTDVTCRLKLGGNEESRIFKAFADAVIAGELIPDSKMPALSEEETFIGTILCKTEDGIEVPLGLHRGGYVSTHYVLVKIDEAAFNGMVSLLKETLFAPYDLATFIAPPDTVTTSVCTLEDTSGAKHLYFHKSDTRPGEISLLWYIGEKIDSTNSTVKEIAIPSAGLRGMKVTEASVIYSRATSDDGYGCEFIIGQTDGEVVQYLLYSNEENANFYEWVRFDFVRTMTEDEVDALRVRYPDSFVGRQ